ncbi:hypothetical protein LCGC14_0245900 [marine sediment metagenome]|uniref:Uncharacterized protein n=1 Tax=marine sediment metagenome TaxID=412755 RepID=A0A0F9UAL4_9ZZZZ
MYRITEKLQGQLVVGYKIAYTTKEDGYYNSVYTSMVYDTGKIPDLSMLMTNKGMVPLNSLPVHPQLTYLRSEQFLLDDTDIFNEVLRDHFSKYHHKKTALYANLLDAQRHLGKLKYWLDDHPTDYSLDYQPPNIILVVLQMEGRAWWRIQNTEDPSNYLAGAKGFLIGNIKSIEELNRI